MEKNSNALQSHSMVLISEDGTPIIADLVGTVFLSVFSLEHRSGCAALLNPGDLGHERVGAFLAKIEAELECPTSSCEVKAVGESTLISNLKRALGHLGITLKSSAEKAGPGVAVRFHPATGRLQVAGTEAGKTADRSGSSSTLGATLSGSSTASSMEKSATAETKKVRVLIVDDSSTIRSLLTNIFSRDPNIEVVAVAERPSQVEALLIEYKPDVVTLDIHMPEMDGVTLLKQFLPKHSVPVVIISSLSMSEGPLVLEALEVGAVDYIQKPSFEALEQMAPYIAEKVRVAAQAKLRRSASNRPVARRLTSAVVAGETLIAIGSSTGGTEALKEVLIRMPEKIPPIVIVKQIPAVFSLAFANRMNDLCPFEVKEAVDGDEVLPNRVIIAPGGKQMRLKRNGLKLCVEVDDSPHVNRHKPSVDVLFDSVAELLGPNALGVILTGMGTDGAKGMLKMREAGARTVAQNEETCVVYGMPREAAKIGAAQEVKPLFEIPELLVKWLASKPDRKSKAA